MENPYAASSLRAEPPAGSARRRPIWKSLLIAYAVHHVAGVLGFCAAYMYLGSFSVLFGSWTSVLYVLTGVPVFDLWLIIEPLGAGKVVPATYVGLRCLRSLAAVTSLAAIIAYAATRRRAWLWYIGVVTFLLFFSLVLSRVADRNTAGFGG
jgi:hypothetical protein